MDVSALRPYELVLASGRSASPYVWRIRYARAHKRLAREKAPAGSMEIPGIHAGRFETVPMFEHAGIPVGVSWDTGKCLDRAFPDLPCFSRPVERAWLERGAGLRGEIGAELRTLPRFD